MSKADVEVLIFEGCPHLDVAMERVREAATRLDVAADVRIVRIENEEQAKELRFLGSPTVRVGGADVEPGAGQRDDYALQCRVYSVAGHFEGAPPVDWIVAALRGTVKKPTAKTR